MTEFLKREMRNAHKVAERASLTSEEKYLALMRRIRDDGIRKGDRTGTGQIELFGPQLDLDLSEGFPLLTTKRVWWKGVVEELLWMLSGETSVKPLQERGVRIWDDWADENGDLGPVYGKQWRQWERLKPVPGTRVVCNVAGAFTGTNMGGDVQGYSRETLDQIAGVIERIRTKPDDRRLIVSAWNVAQIYQMRLPPCHCLFQFCVQECYLHCHMYQRSADYFLGVPFNIASYALLTHMIAHITGLEAGRLIISFGSAHLYLNHIEQVDEQLGREPRPLPTLSLKHCWKEKGPLESPCRVPYDNIDDFESEDLIEALDGYDPHPPIKAPIAV